MSARAAKDKFKRSTPAEEARIKKGIAADSDTRELTKQDFARMRPFSEVVKRGRPKSDVHKVPVTVRLDETIVAFFRDTGPGWQTRVNAALAAHVARARRDSSRTKRAARSQ